MGRPRGQGLGRGIDLRPEYEHFTNTEHYQSAGEWILGYTETKHMTKASWLVGCFGFNGPLRQYFSQYRAVSQREGEREEKRTDESKHVQTTPTRTYNKRSRPLPSC